jgi:transcription antitermination protein NusB
MIPEKREQNLTRRDARERAMQVLYAYEISREPVEMLVESIAGAELEKDPELFEFSQRLVYSTLNHRTDIEPQIARHTRNWQLERIAFLDRIILSLAICEFLYFPDIPARVTINEYIEIARRYSTDRSDRFINGVLDGALRALTEEKLLHKAGRGLA